MNATFNLKRFFLLEQYKKQETGRHLLWSAGIVLGICLLCMMYDINKGSSYYIEHTQAFSLSRYVLWFLCIAPCLLEINITKQTSTLYLLMPASVFEKFLHLWMKYILIIPLFCILLIAVLKGIFNLSGIDYLQYFGSQIKPYIIQKDQMLTYSLLQGTLCSPADTKGYWLSNIIAYPIYNFPMSSTGEAVIAFCNYATPALFTIGTWISSYFLLKEKQL